MVKAAGSWEAMEQTYNPTHSNNPEYYNLSNSSNESVKICVLDVKNSLCNKHCNSSITLLHGIVIMHACMHTYIHTYEISLSLIPGAHWHRIYSTSYE
jgi:hypothetical protein